MIYASKTIQNLYSVAALALLTAMPSEAWAQFMGDDEVIVTATRREQSKQDVPVTVSALTGDELSSAGVVETSDLSGQVPNLIIQSPFGATQPNFILRGISVGNEFNANQASPIGFYVDENYISARFAQGMQLYDLERIEVVKGPQGTLYGRNTTGGAINVITKKPSLGDSEGYLSAGYGNFNTVTASGAGEVTLVPDKLGIRAAATYGNGDGQIEALNPNVEEDFRSTDYISARATALFRPTESLEFILSGYVSDNSGTSDAPVGLGVGPGGTQPLGYVRPASYNNFQTDADNQGIYGTDGSGVNLKTTWNNDSLSIISITAFDEGSLRVEQDSDGSPLPWFNIEWFSDYEQFNQDLRLQFSTDKLFLTVGAYYGWDENKTFNQYNFFPALQAVLPGFNPPANPAASLAVGLNPNSPVTGFQVDHDFTQVRTSYAAYAEAEFAVSDEITIIGGLRYTNDEIEVKDITSIAQDYDGTPQFSLLPPGPIGPVFGPISNSDDQITGRLVLQYEPSNDLNFYGSYSLGYRSGAINGTAYLSPAQLTFVEPEEIEAFELGLKSRLADGALTFNAAAFYYDYKNQQVQEIINVVPFLRNAPKAEAYGLDLEAIWTVSDTVRLNAGLGLISTEYKELTLSGVDLAGNRFTNAPNVTANLGGDWIAYSQGHSEVRLSADATYIGDHFFSPFNEGPSFVGDPIGNGNQQQDGYLKVDGRATWSYKNYDFSIWGRNLFKKEYFSYGLDLRNGFGFDYLVAGQARTYGVEAKVNF